MSSVLGSRVMLAICKPEFVLALSTQGFSQGLDIRNTKKGGGGSESVLSSRCLPNLLVPQAVSVFASVIV